MSFSGMDIDGVLRGARMLETDAVDRLFGVITQMQGIIPELSAAWKGPDADHFVQQWGEHHQTLTRLHTTLTEVVSSVSVAIAAQTQASDH